MDGQPQPSEPRRRNVVVGKAQGEWGDTLPGAQVDTMANAENAENAEGADNAANDADSAHHATKAAHPPIIGIEEMPPAADAAD